MNFIAFIGALSLSVTLSFCRPAFLCGSSFDSPILLKLLLDACLHPSMMIFFATPSKKLEISPNRPRCRQPLLEMRWMRAQI
jgi:hypothetical protein